MSFLRKLFGAKTTVENQFEAYRSKIYPWVKVVFSGDNDPRNIADQIQLDDLPVNKPWLADLSIFYVVDEGSQFRVITASELSGGITQDELHRIATENLNADVTYTLSETSFGCYGLIAGGDHEAGAICLPGIWQWLIDHFNSSLIVAIPAKDLVWIVPETDEENLNNLKIAVHEMFNNGERLLTRYIFKIEKDTAQWTVVDMVGDYK